MPARLALIVAATFVLIAVPASAQPPSPVIVAPSGVVEGTTVTFTWRASPGATWYQVWVNDAVANPKFVEWYTAAQAGCASGAGMCTVSLSQEFAAGQAQWWVRGYADGTGNGPWSSALTFQVRFLPTGWEVALTGASRFQLVLGGAAVLDRETGLVWERQPPSGVYVTWRNALLACVNKTIGGRKGWRLPNVQELATLYNPAGAGFTGGLPAGHPFVPPSSYNAWTSTAGVDAGLAFIVSFTIGGNDGAFMQNSAGTFPAWCVRGGAGRDVQ